MCIRDRSYIGLTRADFAANPYKRYGASSQDKMDNDYHRYILTYNMDLSPATNFVGKVYKTKYSRNWKKMGSINVDDDGSAGGDTTEIELDDSGLDWTTNCAAGTTVGKRACNIITNGTAMVTGEYLKRAMGHRDYGMYGYDMKLNHVMGNHDMTFGYRHHHDYRNRQDNGDSQKWVLGSNNTLVLDTNTVGTEGIQQERKSAWAESISFQDRITHGNFVTTLGVRYEDVDYDKIAKTSGTLTKFSNSETMLAASTAYSMGEGKTAFIGYSQGYNPTGASSVEPEESDNYEIGYRLSLIHI